MKVKKALALLLALVLTVGLLPGRALAAEDDGFTVVNTEQELTSELSKGTEKIKLGKDISSTKNDLFFVKSNLVLDLDGHTWATPEIEGGDGRINVMDGADVTVLNGTLTVSGKDSTTINQRGGTLTLSDVELVGNVWCTGGELVSMEDCVITGRIYIGEDATARIIKNCTLTKQATGMGENIISVFGAIDTIEGCTITITASDDASYARGFHISGSVGSIKDCTITSNSDWSMGIYIGGAGNVDSIEGCIITAVEPILCEEESKVGEISGCTLTGTYVCISAGGISIGEIRGNMMNATAENVARDIEVSGTIGTVSGNTFKTTCNSLVLHSNAKIEKIIDNTSNGTLHSEGKIGTVSGNIHWMIENMGTIDLLGKNFLGRSDMPIYNKGTIKETDTSSPLDSLDKNEWYYEAMAYAYERGLTAGIPSADFKPGDKLTRAMLTQMLWNLEEWPAPSSGKFTDVASNVWYRNSVNWAADKKVVTGYDGKFMPEDNITREQVATILYRYVKGNGGDVSGKADLSGYKDASKISTYAQEAMQWAVAEKLIRGSSGALNPKGNTTCAEMATIMMRLVEGPEEPQPVTSVNLVSGTWVSDGDTLYDDTDGHKLFDLKSVKGNTLTFTLESVGAAPYYRIASTYPITVTLVNGNATFPVNDSWGNSGTGVITVKGDYCIHITVDITSSDPNALWDIAMNSDFYPYGYI